MKLKKSKILLLGKTPPPYMGPSIATQIILKSSLNEHFHIIHQETKLNNSLNSIGKINASKPFILLYRYISFLSKIIFFRPSLVIVPISQTWGGFKKDAVFISFSAFLGCKTLVHLRGSNFLKFYENLNLKRKQFIDKKLGLCAGVIVLGEKLKYIFEPFFPHGSIFVVPNGGNFTFSNQIKNNSNRINLIYLGNLQPSKGIIDLIYACGKLNIQEFQLFVAGQWRDNETKNESIKYIADHNLPVKFQNVLSGQEKLDFLASCDIMVFPPREPEGHPWVIIEAMAAGLPIISTDQGAITESVIDEVNGFIVEKQNPQQIAKNIQFLIDNPDIREKMGKESRLLYEEKFTENIMVENLKKVFEAVINNS